MEQNKMLLMAKERQEVEMTAQGETLEVRILMVLLCNHMKRSFIICTKFSAGGP
jgi:hypothetical protein